MNNEMPMTIGEILDAMLAGDIAADNCDIDAVIWYKNHLQELEANNY